MTRTESNTQTDTPVWSAHHLPRAKPSRMLRFSVLAMAAGLVVIVLASAVRGPIQTTGTQMEPARFKSEPHQAAKAGPTGIVVAAETN